MTTDPKFCLVTVTYAGDLERFERLCASIDKTMPDVTHYVLVDGVDYDAFANMRSAKRQIIATDTVLPQLKYFSFRGKRYWLSLFGAIVRPWIFQQLIKIKFVSERSEDMAIVVDSDAIFIRPITEQHLYQDGKAALYHAPGAANQPSHQKWHIAAAKALKIKAQNYFGSDYISTAVPWKPAVVKSMIAHIENNHVRPWYAVLASYFRFSEYIIYGVYNSHVSGEHQEQLYRTTKELCHCSWHYDLSDSHQLDKFVDDLHDHHVAVLVQSNLEMSVDDTDKIYDRFT